MAQAAKPTDKKFDPKSIAKWGTQVPPVSTETSISDFTDFGRSQADAEAVSSRRNNLLVDGFAQPPFKGALGEIVPGTGPLPEARVLKGRGYAPLVMMTGLGTAKDWVLFDFKRGWPKTLKNPPAVFVKFQEFKPGNKRVVLFNEGSGNVTLKSTPEILEGKGVLYTKTGPKIVEAAEVLVADANAPLQSATTVERAEVPLSGAALSAARKMAPALRRTDDAPESAMRSTLRKTPAASNGKAASKKSQTIASKAAMSKPSQPEDLVSVDEARSITTGTTLTTTKIIATTEITQIAADDAGSGSQPITRSNTSGTEGATKTGATTLETSPAKSTTSESSMSSAFAEVPGITGAKNKPAAKSRKVSKTVEPNDELSPKPCQKRKAEAEAESSDALEPSSSSTIGGNDSASPPAKKQKTTLEAAPPVDLTNFATSSANIAVASAPILSTSAPIIAAPPSPRKRNKRHADLPPRELPPREGRGKNSKLNPDMVLSSEHIEATGRRRKAAAVKQEVAEKPAAKKVKLSAEDAKIAPEIAAPANVERKSGRAASVARSAPKEVAKQNAKPSAAVAAKASTTGMSSADMLDAALNMVAAERYAASSAEAEAAQKTKK